MEPHLRSARLTPTRRALLVVLTIVGVLGLLPVTSATALTPCEVRYSCVTVETPVKGTVPREIAVRSHAGTA